MPDQLLLPGFDAPPSADARPTHRLFLGLFPQADDVARIAAPIDALLQQQGLRGRPILAAHRHVTLHALGDFVGDVPPRLIESAMAAAASVQHPPLHIVLDRALSFVRGKAGNHPFVLCGSDTSAVSQLGAALGLALKRAGLRHVPSGKPHMTMVYSNRIVDEHSVEPIRWTATELVLVRSHLGKTQHEWLARWPLAGPG